MANSSIPAGRLSPEALRQFREDGYAIVKSLFSPEEVEEIKSEFMGIAESGAIPGYFEPAGGEEGRTDPLKRYPRILYPHRINGVAKKYMLHGDVMASLAELFGEAALSAQSMFYFKPPGARGQALHQDNYYLKTEPGTCIAAWTAIDPADRENGGLVIVPRTNRLDIECPHLADPSVSFTTDEVTLPEGAIIVEANMDAGDVLFFNGSMIHGSYPNSSKDRFRRAFICHYVGESTASIGHHINWDLHDAEGRVRPRERNDDGGPCGTEFAGAPH